MKFAVAIVLCCLVVATLADLPEDLKQKLKVANTKCQENPATAIDEAAVKAWNKAGRDASKRPANLGPHSLCIAKLLDWIKEDGTPNKEGLKEKISHRIADSAKAEELLNKCTVKQETPEEAAQLLFKCLLSF